MGILQNVKDVPDLFPMAGMLDPFLEETLAWIIDQEQVEINVKVMLEEA